MNYLESIAYLESLSPTLERPSLARMLCFMNDKGNIQNDLACFHVGGTNGKGSTVAILDSVLRSFGFKTGRFTGPHLLRWNERFCVDGKAIDDDAFADLATRIRELSDAFAGRHPEFGPLTWFEFLTAMAFFYFKECRVNVALYEVGLGGRFDATNVVENVLASIITNVTLDHTHLLGETVEEIASEKAGIIKPGRPVITAATGGALDVIRKRAHESGAPLFVCLQSRTDSLEAECDDVPVEACLDELGDLKGVIASRLSLTGPHQRLNAFVALEALAVSRMPPFDCDDCQDASVPVLPAQDRKGNERLSSGLENVRWAGRLQYLKERGLILDGAHNPAGAVALKEALDFEFPQFKRIFILTCFGSKDARAMLFALLRPGDRVFVAEAKGRRQSHDPAILAELAAGTGAEATTFTSIGEALFHAFRLRSDDDLIVVSGSFAAVRESMLFLGFNDIEQSFESSLSFSEPVSA